MCMSNISPGRSKSLGDILNTKNLEKSTHSYRVGLDGISGSQFWMRIGDDLMEKGLPSTLPKKPFIRNLA